MNYQLDYISLKGQFPSKYLNRKVKFRWVAPASYQNTQKTFPVLLMNDGQDFTAMNLEKTLIQSFHSRKNKPFIYIGVETNHQRMQEYGLAHAADFKGRGARAKDYAAFIMQEFIPFLKQEFKVSPDPLDWVYCGMSLGGLSAFDIVYNHPDSFGKVGVFSGSFWWRNKAYDPQDHLDRSRMVLNMVENRAHAAHLKFWFQCGTEDEKADRNKNGIIDAIDDTQDLIKELEKKGYSYPGDIVYLEIEGGKHDLPTWGAVFPDFINWAFGKVGGRETNAILDDKHGQASPH
ncbi:alpha/beta hydrolase [Croceiramulus getboli]|nr:alpha/beta hydrolase-fold protein [Flavobacteriaceae bacterium YJPT1-3]